MGPGRPFGELYNVALGPDSEQLEVPHIFWLPLSPLLDPLQSESSSLSVSGCVNGELLQATPATTKSVHRGAPRLRKLTADSNRTWFAAQNGSALTPSSFLVNIKLESNGDMKTSFPVGPITDFASPLELTVPTGLPEVRSSRL